MKHIVLLIVIFTTVFSAYAQDTSLNVYSGRYTFPEGSRVTESMVEVKDNKLYISSALGAATLTRQQGDTFSVDEYGGQIAFLRDTTKAVTGIKVNIPAADLDLQGVKAGNAPGIGAAFDSQSSKYCLIRKEKYWNNPELDASLVYSN
jgi:hypothetical protein